MAVAAGVARPLVKRERAAGTGRRGWILTFSVGAFLGAVTTGAAVAVVAAALPGGSPTLIGAASAAALLVGIDVVMSQQYSVLSIPRQTCSTWFTRMSPSRTFFIWGYDLGLGFSTFRVSALYWVVLIALVVRSGNGGAAPLVLLFYAAGVIAAVLVTLKITPTAPAAAIRDRIFALLPAMRLCSNALAVALTLTLLAGVL